MKETRISDDSEQYTIARQDDTVAEVLGPDDHDCVRGLGRFVTPGSYKDHPPRMLTSLTYLPKTKSFQRSQVKLTKCNVDERQN